MLAHLGGNESGGSRVRRVFDEQGADAHGVGGIDLGGVRDAVEIGHILGYGGARESLDEKRASWVEERRDAGQIEGTWGKGSDRSGGEARPAEGDGVRVGRRGSGCGEGGYVDGDGLSGAKGRGVRCTLKATQNADGLRWQALSIDEERVRSGIAG